MEEYIVEEIVTPEESIPAQQPAPKRGNKRLWLVIFCAAVVAMAAAFLFTAKPRQYARAAKLYESGRYQQAAQAYAELGDYRDSARKEADARYVYAGQLAKEKDHAGALAIYEALGDHKESPQRALECYYKLGEEALEQKDYMQALELFTKATDDFRDTRQRRMNAAYQVGHDLFLKGEYQQAQTYFDMLQGQWPAGSGPHFVTFDEALDYIHTQAKDLPEAVTVVVKDMPGTYILRPDILNIDIQQRLGYQFATVNYSEKSKAVTVIPSYYPGQRILHAMETGDFSGLTPAEKVTYQEAERLIRQAKAADPDPEAMELWLHDWLCQNVEYDSPYEYVFPEDFVGLDELTCVGAILNGKANCQGYTDAFYLLGSMAGLDVYVIFGYVGEGGHCWNGVFMDGRTYTVDVTFDDTYVPEQEYWTYIWYNNVLDLDEYSVLGGSTLFPNMVTRKDLSKTYYARTDNVYEDLGDAAFGLLRQYRKNGAGVYHAVVDSPNQTEDDFYKAVANNMGLAGVYSVQWYVDLYTYEEDTYIWVQWVED